MIWTPAPSFKAADWAESACSGWKPVSSVMRGKTTLSLSWRRSLRSARLEKRCACFIYAFYVQALGYFRDEGRTSGPAGTGAKAELDFRLERCTATRIFLLECPVTNCRGSKIRSE